MPKKKKSKKSTTIQVNKASVLQWRDVFKGETLHFLLGLLLLCTAIFMTLAFISYISTAANDQSYLEAVSQTGTYSSGSVTTDVKVSNQAGKFGAQTAHFFMNNCFGLAAFFIPLFLIFAAMRLMRTYRINLWRKFLNYAFLMIWCSVALAFFMPKEFLDKFALHPGGMHGKQICDYMGGLIGTPGLFILIVVTAIFYLIYLSKRTIIVIRKLMHPKELLLQHNKDKAAEPDDTPTTGDDAEETGAPDADTTEPALTDADAEEPAAADDTPRDDAPSQPIDLTDLPASQPEEEKPEKKDFTVTQGEKEEAASGKTVNNDYDPKLDLEFYKYPTISLLKKYSDDQPSIDMAEQQANKERITNILHNFGVEISSIKATVGPTITLYEITPAKGVRISKIKNLEDDIALSLSALGIRIIAPIPGKGTIGIEVPNKKPHIVSMESIINSRKFQESDYELPMALGKTITNEVYMADLAKMPHLLVAGATGQGKSVGLNAIITSLLYKKHPSELKMVMVDPKKVEFSIYAPLANFFLATLPDESDDPIITDVSKVVRTLKSLCQEMDDRYLLLKKAHAKNIKDYNAKFKSRQLNPDNGHRFLPYLVVIIDEFGDLIMTAGKEVEIPIARIAQLGRAAGMHMIIATQRPTTNIITGTIKANFPARMAFKVMSQIDSRTILDQAGANQLVGRGDMLFLAGNMPVRIQCAFVDTPEVERITEFISSQQGYLTPYELPEVASDDSETGGTGGDVPDKFDGLFEEAARLIVIHQSGSTSLIQRKFSIGYNRAGRIMDQMERAGIVGPSKGGKPRDVLCADETDLQLKLDQLKN
jgi:S-DNA-T family DNA segregation ATPase FtsK/SpoIIIE